MLIEDILLNKDNSLVTIGPDAAVADVVATLTEHNIGALPVCDGDGALVGIISERDVVRNIARQGDSVLDLRISDVMTKDVVTCTPADDANDVMGVMKGNRIRHVPVVTDGRVINMVSARDAMVAMLEESLEQRRTLATAYEIVR